MPTASSALSDASLSSVLGINAINPSLHVHARDFIQATYPNNSDRQNFGLQLVTLAETQYGHGWKGPGAGSFNWGAVQSPRRKDGSYADGPAGFFVTGDNKYDATKGGVVGYQTHFRKYHNDTEGLNDVAVTLLKPNYRAAVDTGSLLMAVTAQFGNGYYTGVQKVPADNVRAYFHFLAQWIPALEAALHQALPFTDAHIVPTRDDVQKAWDVLAGKAGTQIHGGGLAGSKPIPISTAAVRTLAAANPPSPTGPRHFILIEGEPAQLQTLAASVKSAGVPGVVATNTFVPGTGWTDWSKHT
jgi:hypothetical protein